MNSNFLSQLILQCLHTLVWSMMYTVRWIAKESPSREDQCHCYEELEKLNLKEEEAIQQDLLLLFAQEINREKLSSRSDRQSFRFSRMMRRPATPMPCAPSVVRSSVRVNPKSLSLPLRAAARRRH